MNQPSKPYGPANRQWWTPRRVLCISALLLAALYAVAQPKLEQWLGIDLPNIVSSDDGDGNQRDGARAEDGQFRVDPDAAKGDSGFSLEKTGRNTWQSPEGLVYTMGPGGQHRIEHIMRHAQNEPQRDVHGVFDANRQSEVLALLDRAYRLVKSRSNVVRSSGPNDQGRIQFDIDLPDRIGYVGGKSGARQNRPATRRLRLVLHDERVITAYPVRESRR